MALGQAIASPQKERVARSAGSKFKRKISAQLFEGLTLVFLLLLLGLVGALGIWIVTRCYDNVPVEDYVLTLLTVLALTALHARLDAAQRRGRDPATTDSGAPFAAFSVSLVLVTLAFFALKIGHEYSRGWIFGWWAAGMSTMASARMVAARLRGRLMERGHLKQKVAVIGASQEARPIIESLSRCPEIHVASIYDDRVRRSPLELHGVPVRGRVSDFLAAPECFDIDRVIITLPLTASKRIAEIVRLLHPLPLSVDLGLDARCGELRLHQGRRTGDLFTIEIHECPLPDVRQLIKSCEDKVIAALLLLVSAPLFAVIAVAIKVDSSGPIFFRQKRYGCANRIFDVLKFRTMYASACDELGDRLTTRGDARVTRIGRILRECSLDELPQLINVLRGEMSIVGPRPHPVRAKAANLLYAEAVGNYGLRQRVRPGITGWAQVHGWRGETTTVEQIRRRVEFDLEYIEKWSLSLDLRIIAMTLFTVLRRNNAL